ncbi:hypothetical protein BaRGS_00027175 [Batillaria attramentaria]|uniref:Uncharacterized protein n=1 Tax=Batillaria attramentaria TaxID=370345 RepID=A0ABD0K3D4_9CAEN
MTREWQATTLLRGAVFIHVHKDFKDTARAAGSRRRAFDVPAVENDPVSSRLPPLAKRYLIGHVTIPARSTCGFTVKEIVQCFEVSSNVIYSRHTQKACEAEHFCVVHYTEYNYICKTDETCRNATITKAEGFAEAVVMRFEHGRRTEPSVMGAKATGQNLG